MFLNEHEGPKAQIHIAGRDEPLWFSQVRDAIAFTRLPEETETVTAIYVNDMSRATSWHDAGDAPWIDADAAAYVIGSRRHGGMGAPEAVPFRDMTQAEAFAAENGGHVARFTEIPDDYVLAPVDVAPQTRHEGHAEHGMQEGAAHDDAGTETKQGAKAATGHGAHDTHQAHVR